MSTSASNPKWLGVLIEELGKESYQFTSDDVLDAFWLAQWVPAANWAGAQPQAREVVAAPETAAKVSQTTDPAQAAEAVVPAASQAKVKPAPPPVSDEIKIYPLTPHAAQPGAMRAAPIRLPGAFALPRALEVGRALRPFKQYRPSYTRFTLDVDATIVFFERYRQLIPQLRPQAERWFDIVLIADDSPSMAVWRRTFSEFERLLSTHGAFRHVRRFTLTDCLKGAKARRDHLQDPERRTLILFLTDGTSPVWNRPDLVGWIRKWAATSPLGIVQMFPPYQWPATTLGRATRETQAPAPGVPNRQLTVSRTWRGGLPGDAVAVPVTTLDPQALAQWANMVMAKRATWNPAVVLRAGAPKAKIAEETLPPQKRVENFGKTASPAAFDLACYLSTVPLSLPVMRVVMEAMIPKPQLSYLAEVLASGLVQPMESGPGTDAELVQYKFDPEVGDLLRAQVRLQEAAQAQEAVQQEIRKFVEKLAGRRLPSDVFLVPDEFGRLNLPKSAEAFLTVKYELAARLRPTVQQMGILHHVPDLPQPFLERPLALEGIVARILSATTTVSLEGTGCNVMAAAALRDVRIRRAFLGGIYWDAPEIHEPEMNRALYVISDYRPQPSPVPERTVVLRILPVTDSRDAYVLPPVAKPETDLYFMTLGLTGQQASELEKCHQFDPDRCLVLARALQRFDTEAVLKLAAAWNGEGLVTPAYSLRKVVLDSLFTAEARTVVHAMCTFYPGEPVPERLVDSVFASMFDRAVVRQAWDLAVEMDFCEGSDPTKFPPLRSLLQYELTRDAPPPLDSRVANHYFQFFDSCWEAVRSDRYLFRHLISHLARMRDFPRIEQLLLDPYWYAHKAAALFGFQEIEYDRIAISDFSELFALGRVLRKASAELDSLAPEVISASLAAWVRSEPEIAAKSALVEQYLRRGFPQSQAQVSGFHLYFERREDVYYVRASGFPAFEMRFEVLVQNVPKRRWDDFTAERSADVDEFGRQLFDIFFAGGEMFRRSRSEAQSRNLRLPIYLHLSDAPELQEIPWEYLRDQSQARFLASDSQTAIVRFIDSSPLKVQPLFVPPLRILVVNANPTALPEAVRQIFHGLQRNSGIVVDYLEQPTVEDIRAKSGYHILHFEGHSISNGGSESSFAESPRVEEIATRLQATALQSEPSFQLAVLVTDHRPGLLGNQATTLIQSGTAAVVMSLFRGSMPAEEAFFRNFYRAIADGYAVDEAAGRARQELEYSITNFPARSTPVLYSNVHDLRFVAPTSAIEPAVENQATARWILVAGTGSYELPPQIAKLAERLGASLAARGLNLIGGGWPGVDHVAARAFANAVQDMGEEIESRFLQVLPPGKRPDLEAGQIVNTEDTFGDAVRRAGAVVLIGGVGGTYGTFLEARKQRKLVYPLPATGGDAKTAFDELLDRSRSDRELSARRLRLLQPAIEDDDSINTLLNRLVALLEGGHGEREWADAMLELVLGTSRLWQEMGFTAYANLREYLRELAASADVPLVPGGLETSLHRHGQQADSSGVLPVQRLRRCLPAASIWISFDILRISELADSHRWGKDRVIHALIPLLFEFCPDQAESTLAAAVQMEPAASATAAELVEAADRLRKKYDFVSAERLYRKALEVPPGNQQDQTATAAAYVGLGRIQSLRGQFDGAAEMFERALELQSRLEDPARMSSTYDGLATVYFTRGEISRAQQTQEQALKTAGSNPRDRSIALNNLGRIHRTLGDFPLASKLHTEALDRATEANLLDIVVDATTNLGITYRHVDTLQRAEELQRKALQISETLGDPALTAQVLNNLAGVLRLRGELNRAEEMNGRALALYDATGWRQGTAESYAGIGLVYRVRGDLAKAEQNLRLALGINQKVGRAFGIADNYNDLGSIRRATGDLDEAQHFHQLALEINQKASRKPVLADTYNALGLVSSFRGDLPRAVDWYRQALSLNESMGRHSGIADGLVNLAAAYRRRRSLDEAENYCQRALDINKNIGRVPAIARSYTNLGQIAYDRGELEKAEQCFRQALQMDEKVGRLEGIAANKYELARLAEQRRDISGARALKLEALQMYQTGGFQRRVQSIRQELATSTSA